MTETTHGEIGFESMRAILSSLDHFGMGHDRGAGRSSGHARTSRRDCLGMFVDVGSGVGRPVIAAALLRPPMAPTFRKGPEGEGEGEGGISGIGDLSGGGGGGGGGGGDSDSTVYRNNDSGVGSAAGFSKSLGLEVLVELHEAACAAAASLDQAREANAAEDDGQGEQREGAKVGEGGEGRTGGPTSFIAGDALSATNMPLWASPSTGVLLVHGTCFGPVLARKIAAACRRLEPGTFVVSVSRPLPARGLQLLGRRNIRCSWGDAVSVPSELPRVQ